MDMLALLKGVFGYDRTDMQRIKGHKSVDALH